MKLTAAFLLAVAAFAQEPVDGVRHIFHDDLLDHLAGTWTLTGTVRGRPVRHSVEARWILNHQFLEIHEIETGDPAPGAVRYEALILIGRDHMSERHVMHWNDVFGGRFSETLGYGAPDGNRITFLFEYPDAPFRTQFLWDPATRQWRWELRTKNAKGQWEEFASVLLQRAPTGV